MNAGGNPAHCKRFSNPVTAPTRGAGFRYMRLYKPCAMMKDAVSCRCGFTKNA